MTTREMRIAGLALVVGMVLGAGALSLRPPTGPKTAPGEWPWKEGNFTVTKGPIGAASPSSESAAGASTWLWQFPTEAQAGEARKRVIEALQRYYEEVNRDD